ncbi:MAG: glucosaminidase domain-containing protein, partial [Magnetospiraceae bacterium]
MIKSLKAGRKRAAAVVSFVAVLTLGVAGTAPKPVYAGPDSKAAQRVSVTQLDQAFTAMDYDFEHLLENGGSVPRILLADLPQGLSKIKDTQARKHMFFKTVLPLVLSVNEDLAEQRARLWVLHAAIAIGQPLSAADQRWFAHMSELYETQPGDLNALFQKVDQIPVSLALVQAAEESGWGRSRFAREGNALFGQWTYGSGGMTPKHRKAG